MIDEKYNHLVTGHLQGTLSDAEQEQLRILIQEKRIDPSELQELEETWRKMDLPKIPELQSGGRLHERFYSMLEEEKTDHSNNVISLASVWQKRLQNGFERYKIGSVAAVFLAGILIGNLFTPINSSDSKIDQLTDEISQMREMMMISLLENDSATERLRAVNISHEIPSTADRVADALLYTLNNDPNVNVRIAAVDALVRHAARPNIRSKMVESIASQESPVVQIALADAMVALQEENAIEQFRKLLDQNDMDHNVRTKLEDTIIALL
ncbi:hypothetical protein BH23BAC3_BH23BAC3_22570 [soil metagenome]